MSLTSVDRLVGTGPELHDMVLICVGFESPGYCSLRRLSLRSKTSSWHLAQTVRRSTGVILRVAEPEGLGHLLWVLESL